MLTINPTAIPLIKIELAIRKQGNREIFGLTYIKAIKHEKKNRESAPCGHELGYSFVVCMKNTISNRVGCRPEWDLKSKGTVPTCDSLEQLLKHEYLYKVLATLEQNWW